MELDIPPLTSMKSYDFQTIRLLFLLTLDQEELKAAVAFPCCISSAYKRAENVVGVL